MMEFTFVSPIIIEESSPDYVDIEFVLVHEGISTHGVEYQLEETGFNNMAKTAVGKDIYYGVDYFGRHDAPRMKAGNMVSGEDWSGKPPVGKVLRTWVDDKARKVMAVARIFGEVRNKIKEGWGISLRAISKAIKVLFKGGRPITRAIDSSIHDIQLLDPSTPRGIKGAKVTKILSESIEFATPLSVILAVIPLIIDGSVDV